MVRAVVPIIKPFFASDSVLVEFRVQTSGYTTTRGKNAPLSLYSCLPTSSLECLVYYMWLTQVN